MRTRCDYCKGTTETDARGGCVACGAPKEDNERNVGFLKPDVVGRDYIRRVTAVSSTTMPENFSFSGKVYLADDFDS
jgi:hypothetical protein